MNRVPVKRWLLVAAFMAVTVSRGVGEEGPSRIGRAIVARMSGQAEYVYPETTSHEYPTGTGQLKEGMALSEPQSIRTGRDGNLCVVLTPGAVLCVAPNTTVKLEKLEQRPDGLPTAEKDLMRRIVLEMSGGSILMHAGAPSPTKVIQVKTPHGTVEATGGDFIVMRDGASWKVMVQKQDVTFRHAGGAVQAGAGRVVILDEDAAGKTVARVESQAPDTMAGAFAVCVSYFEDVEPYAFRVDGADVGGLATWIGQDDSVALIGDPTAWEDVSPSFWTPPPRGATPAAVPPGREASGLWGLREIWAWYRNAGTIRGFNYLPRTAVNSTEMWQADTFDTDTIDEELAWAEKAGFNSVRVVLQYLVWKDNPREFRKRLDTFLSIANRHGMSVVPVLFDDSRYAGKDPYLGPQDDPVEGVFNSQWTPSPGHDRVTGQVEWPFLEQYVADVVGSFRRDRRILFWDLYHTPGNAGLWDRSLPLVESVFKWARERSPRQPLTAGPWTEFGSPMSSRIAELSDLVTMQSFEDAAAVRATVQALSVYERPIVCTDWLDRTRANTFKDILPVFADARVGWYSRGLVQGRAQWYVPQGAANEKAKVWRSDVMEPDGSPYDRAEIDLIRNFRFQSGAAGAGVSGGEEAAVQQQERGE